MAIFEYQALTPAGRAMKGTVEAADSRQAAEILAEMKFSVTSVEKTQAPSPRRSIGRREFLLFNQHLAAIAKAGISLEAALRQLAGEVESAPMRRLINELANDLEAGSTIEQALARRKGFFPPLYGQIVSAGVNSGRLGEMLTCLNRHLEIARQTRRIVFEACSYPAVVLAMAAVVLTLAFRLIVPQFKDIFKDMGIQLPAITLLIFDISDHIVPVALGIGVTIAVAVIAFRALSAFAAGRRFKESVYLRIPVLGSLYRRSLLARLSDAMGLLVGAGCDLPACLRLGAAGAGSEQIKDECEAVAREIEQGRNIVEAGLCCGIIPQLFFYSMQLGHQRNELQDNLYGLCDMYTQQARASQFKLQAVLLPLMLIVVGGLMAMMILALFMPMVSLIQNLGAQSQAH